MSVTAANPFATPGRRARRRRIVGRTMEVLATLAALLAVAVLVLVVASVVKKGWPAINVDFFTKNAAPVFQPGGGIANAIVGTIIITLLATAMAVPAGVLIAIFNTEFAPRRFAEGVRLILNVLAGVPTIVIGIFVFGLLVVGNGYSALAAGFALAVIMLPVVERATEEVLLLVPDTLREGGLALGATRSRTVVRIILPTSVGGIVTGTIVAAARAAGETAPLIFTSSIFANKVSTDVTQAMANIPITILVNAEQPGIHEQQIAWASALVLMTIVLVGAIVGRVLSLRTRRQLERVG